tara:strand:- start:757 stop:1152 length:396 start_codon:yes stop_codon:yes gene_type:complete
MKIFVNGCFDVLHKGHIELFRYAKSLGDNLIVALDSDEKIKKSKGNNRPINNLDDRKMVLEAIKYIDHIESFSTKEELELLVKENNPDILVVGSDWKGKEIVGGRYAKEVRFFERIDGYSTTKILEDSSNR